MFRGFGNVDSKSVGEVVHHPKAMAAYPEMAEMRAQSVPGTGGSFVGEMGYAPSSPTVNLGRDNKSGTNSVSLHELQHAVQGREGFALGGSPESMRSLVSERADMEEKFATALQQFRTTTDEVAKGNALQAMNFYGVRLGKMPKVDNTKDAYKRLAGEAEARATQARINMTPEQRRAMFPEKSYDVPLNELIIRGVND